LRDPGSKKITTEAWRYAEIQREIRENARKRQDAGFEVSVIAQIFL